MNTPNGTIRGNKRDLILVPRNMTTDNLSKDAVNTGPTSPSPSEDNLSLKVIDASVPQQELVNTTLPYQSMGVPELDNCAIQLTWWIRTSSLERESGILLLTAIIVSSHTPHNRPHSM